MTITAAEDRLLVREELETSALVEAVCADESITVHTGSRAERVDSRERMLVVTLAGAQDVAGDRLFVGTGRRIELGDLGLESVGWDGTAPFIKVEENLRGADGIWAIGDVTGNPLLSLVAVYHSKIAAADILGRDHPPVQHHAVPRVTVTDPEVGSVGLTEWEARAADRDVIVAVKQFPATFAGVVPWVERGMI